MTVAPVSAPRKYARSLDFDTQAVALGERVRAVRLSRAWTLEEAAHRMTLDPKYLQKIEAGRINMTLKMQLRVALGLGVAVGQLMPPVDRPDLAPAVPGPGPRVPLPLPEMLSLVGNALRVRRLSCSLTQKQLAHRANVSLSSVQQIELGHQNPTLATLHTLADVLDVGLHDLVCDATAPGVHRAPRVRSRQRNRL